jgi:hypothetical protein
VTAPDRPSSPLLVALLAALAFAPAGTTAQTRPAAAVGALPAAPHADGRPPAPAPQATPAEEEEVTVKTNLDRPAVWVADRVTYTIEITCRRGVDILVDDLSPDKLKLVGLEVVSSDTARQAGSGNVIRYEFRYVLTTYRVDVPTLTIGPLPVRYYARREGERPPDAAPAGTVRVPEAAIAFRSLLPDVQPSYPVRDSRPAAQRLLVYRILRPIGVGLIVLSIVPVGFMAIGLVRRVRQGRRSTVRRSLRQTRQAARAALEEVRAADAATADARRAAFARLDALVRHHLSDVCGVPTPGLTPAEITAVLGACASRMPVDLASSVLTSCELARYARPEFLPSADAWRDTLTQAEQVLAAGR